MRQFYITYQKGTEHRYVVVQADSPELAEAYLVSLSYTVVEVTELYISMNSPVCPECGLPVSLSKTAGVTAPDGVYSCIYCGYEGPTMGPDFLDGLDVLSALKTD